jgi:hypothetical protein
VSQVEAGTCREAKGIESMLAAAAPQADTGEREALGTLLRRLFGKGETKET